MKYLLAVILSAAAMVAAPVHAEAPAVAHHMRFMSMPCPLEDSSSCYWDAQAQGNHVGHSFYSIRVGRRDCVVYWNTQFNRKHGRCYPTGGK